MKVYYINLARATERREYMEATAKRLGLIVHRLEAVDGSVPDAEVIDQLRLDPALSPALGPMEIACTLSHRKAWALIANSDEEYGAIFEDDLMFSGDTAEILANADWIPPDTDIVKLETDCRKTRLSPPVFDIRTGRQLSVLVGTHLGAGGYLLSRDCARRLVQATKIVTQTVDYLLFDRETQILPISIIYQLSPAICVQQIRTSRQFLPSGAKSSYVYKNQWTKRKITVSKGLREIVRPFRQLRHEIANRVWAKRTGGVWKKVPFEE